MTPTRTMRPSGADAGIRVQECQGGGFVVWSGDDVYAACTSPFEVAGAMAALLAARDDGGMMPEPGAGGLPVPARSGADPLPAGIRPGPAPVHRQIVEEAVDGLRAAAGVILAVMAAGLGWVVRV
jgi:hypothetical protein